MSSRAEANEFTKRLGLRHIAVEDMPREDLFGQGIASLESGAPGRAIFSQPLRRD